MNHVQISSEDVLQYANQLTGMEEEISYIFQEIQSKMNYIETIWSSPASQTMISQFQRMKPIFSQYVESLKAYATYLNQTASSYAENEQSLTTHIQFNE